MTLGRAALLPLLLLAACGPAGDTHEGMPAADAYGGSWQTRTGDVHADGREWWGELRLWPRGSRRLRVAYRGYYAYPRPGGIAADTGSADGIGVIEGDSVRFRMKDGRCAITMRRRGRDLVVTQTGTGCFEPHVTAAGTYVRLDPRQPGFGGR